MIDSTLSHQKRDKPSYSKDVIDSTLSHQKRDKPGYRKDVIDSTLSHQKRDQGGVTHIGAVYIAATGVKMWSNGQDTFLGVVKRSSSIPGPITYR